MRNEEKLREMMLRYLEGAVPAADLEQLNRAVETDPAARRELAEMMLQETLLNRIGQEAGVFELQDAKPATARSTTFNTTTRILQIQRTQESNRTRWMAAASAAAILFAFTLLLAVKALQPAEPNAGRIAVAPADNSRPAQPEAAPSIEIPRSPGAPVVAEPRPESTPAVASAPVVTPPPKPRLVETRKDRPAVPVPALPDPAIPAPSQPANVTPVIPQPDRPPIDPAGRYWETSIAKIERVVGEVVVLSGAVRKPAKAGQEILWGQGLETVSVNATVVIRYTDGTRVELAPRTAVWESSDRPTARGTEGPKRLRIGAGTVTADVAKQAPGRPMILTTAHGEAKILGTIFKLVVEPESMRLEMKEGKIQVTRKDDQATADVGAGFYVVVGKGIPLEVKALPAADGVNRNSRTK